MKRKPIRVDWDELEVAFTNQDVELVYYLDLVTGHVILEGEGEEDEFDDSDDFQQAPAPPRRDDSTRAYVTSLDDGTKVEWMRTFIHRDSELGVETVARLKQALEAENPAQALGEVLREEAEARDRWYLYRSDRLHDLIEEWIERHEVTAVDPPPWKH